MTDFRIATVEDFDPTEVVQLPSMQGTDLAVKLQQPDPFKLLLAGKNGNIPDFLTNVIVNALSGKTTTTEANMDDPEMLKGIFDMMDIITIASFVTPKVVADKDYVDGSDTVPVSRIKPGDRAWVMNWALGVGFNSIETFPAGQEPADDTVDDVSEGEDVPAGTEPVATDKK